MLDTIRQRFGKLQCDAAFWSLRYVDERARYVCVRQDVAEAPSLEQDCGAMLTVYDAGGYGYAATADLSVAARQLRHQPAPSEHRLHDPGLARPGP